MASATAAGLADLVARALAEDVGPGDLTTEATVPAAARAAGEVVRKQPGAVFGFEVAAEVFRQVDPAVALEPLAAEGEWSDQTPAAVARAEGPARALLTGERTALNFLQRLSGVATLTARYVRAVEGTGAIVLDTRKTTPGLRFLEKAAVRAGGGQNHRQGLYDAILVKDNHVALAGGMAEAARLALAAAPPGMPVEIECARLDQLEEALQAGAKRLLLDNMTPAGLREAVGAVAGRAELEASGGVTLDTVREIAASGVDFVSVGALTHSAPALDLSLELHDI